MIKMDQVTKIYRGSDTPAVDSLTIEVPEGETCVVIGPSGCGKTTTLKMVNRLIEPTSGRILVADEDIMDRDPVQLRRTIGYVIQQIGLFPHMTIRDNIATVPKLLGWDNDRIDNRADELLALVGMEPEAFRDRYPRELSGGQRQRVGVARALAADPPVMLMDEPFGAIDPITRDRLQNEFLRLQKKIHKTIMFVTHDIDEAIKMGTLLCILQVGGVLEQFDTPSNILSDPANKFVADFVGADRGLKRLSLVRAGEMMRTDIELVRHDQPADSVRAMMKERGFESLLVVDEEQKLIGYLSLDVVETSRGKKAGELAEPIIASTEEEATMKDAFSEMLSTGVGYLPVLGEGDAVVGIVTASDTQRLIEQTSSQRGKG
ncbi:MAG: betaine/proline/choline family ABC transporter ATP-binding protein [Anaerolineales bacterium]|jgi:osmoprotectant transport system ATP-binding protein